MISASPSRAKTVSLVEGFAAIDPEEPIRFLDRSEPRRKPARTSADAGVFTESNLPQPLAFDHAAILADYFRFRRTGVRFIAVRPEHAQLIAGYCRRRWLIG